MSDQSNSGKIGDLLVEAGLLSWQDLKEGMDLSATLGLPIGKTMVMSGMLSAQCVRAAVLIQSMLKDRLIEKDTALKALSRSSSENMPIEDCLLELGWKPHKDDANANKLAEILLEADAVKAEDLKEAMEQATAMGLPLGRVLVLSSKCKSQVVWCALNAQMLVRERKISRQQAAQAVKAAHERQASLEQGLREQGLQELAPEHKIRLGELLVLSGIVDEEDILGAVEESVIQERPLGQVLVNSSLLSGERLAEALKLQEMTDKKELSPLQAVDVLRTVETRQLPLARAIAEFGLMKAQRADNIKLGELLQLCGLVSEAEIEEAVRLAAKNSNLLGKMLVAFGFMDESMLHNTLRCQFLIRESLINREQAVIALNYAKRTSRTLDESIKELGFGAG